MRKRLILQTIGALIAGLISSLTLDREAFETASGNIVAALSIINAAIFPTVVLSATVLKGNALSLVLVERYRTALHTQISFFFGILLFSLMTIGTVILAQVMKWTFAFTIPWIGYHFAWNEIFNFFIVFLGSFVAFRLPAFLRALVSLLDVHIDGVAEEVNELEKRKRDERRQELSQLPDISKHQRPPERTPIGS